MTWFAFRHPYDRRYFTTSMQEKYASVEAVLDALYSGDAVRINEAYGYRRVNESNWSGSPPMSWAGIKIRHYPSKKMAWGGGRTYLWRKGRWVFYPETPWLPVLERQHGGLSISPDQKHNAAAGPASRPVFEF